MPTNKTFCILPFVHTTVQTNGDFTLCCRSTQSHDYNIKANTIEEWWSSEYLTDVRDKMLKGQSVTACEVCYQVEERNITSHREKKNKEYKILNTDHSEKIVKHLKYDQLTSPIDLEVHMTNLCNLKCLMCNEVESSTILVENKQLGIARHNAQDYVWNEFATAQIRELFSSTTRKHVDFRGGEPFMVPELREILELAATNGTAKNISLNLTTNCTKFGDDWIDLLNQFEKVRFMCSVDATGELLEYIRYGSKWETIKDNISKMRNVNNVDMMINATIQNLNVLGFADLFKWCEEEQLVLNVEPLLYPIYYQVNNLPYEVRMTAIEQLQQLNSTDVKLIELIEYLKIDAGHEQWQMFVSNIKLRESVRGNSIIKVIPQLKAHF
jgi:MoaA/NifB/PqqE/SkfB family radical SAM enzyme